MMKKIIKIFESLKTLEKKGFIDEIDIVFDGCDKCSRDESLIMLAIEMASYITTEEEKKNEMIKSRKKKKKKQERKQKKKMKKKFK